jgi:hypothetical protein
MEPNVTGAFTRKAPARGGAEFAYHGFRSLGLRQHRSTARVERTAHVRQALPARRPIEELRAEMRLEEADMLADHLGRQPECGPGRGEGAKIRRLHEDGHARQTVHDCQLSVSNLPMNWCLICRIVVNYL